MSWGTNESGRLEGPGRQPLFAILLCLSILTGCSGDKVEMRTLENGELIEVTLNRSGGVRRIRHLDKSTNELIRVEIALSGWKTKQVRVEGPDGATLDEVTFKQDSVSTTSRSSLVRFQGSWFSSARGYVETNSWTHKDGHNVYSEEIEMDPRGRLISKKMRGPHGADLGTILPATE